MYSFSRKLLIVFSMHLAATGLMFLWQPTILWQVLPEPSSSTAYSIIGVLVLALASYYWQLARLDNLQLYRMTNITRCCVMIAFTLLAMLGRIEPIFIVFGLVDLTFALLSMWDLRNGGDK